MKKGDEYTCANCGETFNAAWDDDEAWAESDANGFASVAKVDMCVVCDGCYKEMGFDAAVPDKQEET